MANVVLVKGNNRQTVEVGSQKHKTLLAAKFVVESAAPEQGGSNAAIMAAVNANKREIAVDGDTDLKALRAELEGAGKMASGASVPANAALGPCLSATCHKPTRLVKSAQSGNYYFREDYTVVDAEGNEFKAFCLNADVFVNEGDSADVEVVGGAATRTGLALQYIAA